VRLQPGGVSQRALKRIAVVTGALFVLVGIAALAGNPDNAVGSRPTGKYIQVLEDLRSLLGDPWGALAMIVAGLVVGGLLYWLAARRG
jgi:hypothetical protein